MQVIILDPTTKGHVTQRMHNPKIVMVRYIQPKGRLMHDMASISETSKPINMKFQDSKFGQRKMCPAMLYCDVITNPRWRTAGILKIVKSSYLSK